MSSALGFTIVGDGSTNLAPDPNASIPLVPGGASNLNPTPITLPTPTPLTLAPPINNQTTTAVSTTGASSNAIAATNTAISYTPTIGPSRSNWIRNNGLDNYINVVPNIALSMVSSDAVVNKLNVDVQPRNLIADTDYFTFASTGDATTDSSNNANGISYYNIKDFTFTNFLGHTPQNPMVAVIFDAKMKLFEPYGFSFREDLLTLSRLAGYQDLEPLNYIYMIEIWFSGYDPITGAWTSRIPIPVHDTLNIPSIIYYINITVAETVVTTQGTSYDLSMVQYAHKATRAESISLNFGTINSTINVQLPQGQNKFINWLDSLAQAMESLVKLETGGHFTPIYKFYVPSWLGNLTFASDFKGIDFTTMASYDPSAGMYTMSGSNTELYTFIKKAIDCLPDYRTFHLNEADTIFVEPTTLFNIRAHMQHTGTYDSVINGYNSYTFIYLIEPVSSFRSKMTAMVENRNDRVQTSSQVSRAQQLEMMEVREYDFIFTKDNSEIIDFQLMYKNFYQEAYPHPSDTLPDKGQKLKDPTTTPNTNNYPLGGVSAVQPSNTPVQQSNPQSANGIVPPSHIHQGVTRGAPLGESAEGDTKDILLYRKSQEQYYQYDMLNVVMTVRGDPVWLMNTYMAKDNANDDLMGYQEQPDGFTLYNIVDRTVYVHAYKPIQSNYMNPTPTSGSSGITPTLDGWYQVIQVANVISGGIFIQRINMFKYQHMNNAPTDQSQVGGTGNQIGTANNIVDNSPDPNATGSLGG